VIGGYVYRGALPALIGKYVFGDLLGPLGSARLFFTELTDGTIFEFYLRDPSPLTGAFLERFGRDDVDDLYILIDTNIGPSGIVGTVLKAVGAANR